jgi:hypothetical protein
LYGCETWPVTLTEELRLRACKNRALRKIFGSKRDEVTGDFMTLHNEELHDFFSSRGIFPVMKSKKTSWAGHVACMEERRGAHRVLMGKPQGK